MIMLVLISDEFAQRGDYCYYLLYLFIHKYMCVSRLLYVNKSTAYIILGVCVCVCYTNTRLGNDYDLPTN